MPRVPTSHRTEVPLDAFARALAAERAGGAPLAPAPVVAPRRDVESCPSTAAARGASVSRPGGRQRSRVHLAFWLFLVLLGGAGPARATEPAGAATPGRTMTVTITVIGTFEDLRWARSLVGGSGSAAARARWRQAERFDVRELFAVSPEGEPSLASWVDLSDPRCARLYFAAPSGERFLVREVELSGRFDELDRAALAEVLELSLAALRENELAGLSREETLERLAEQGPAAPLPSPAVSPPSRALPVVVAPGAPALATGRGALGAAASLALQVLSPDLPLGKRIGLEGWGGRRLGDRWWAFTLAAEYQLAVRARTQEIGMDLRALAVHAGVELGHAWPRPSPEARHGASALFARLGLGVDFVEVAPRAGTRAVPVDLAGRHGSSSLVLRGALGIAWALGGRVALDARGFADLLPTAVHYDVRRDGQVEAAFAPWRIRPGLMLAVALR